MSSLDSWTRSTHSADGITHDTYRKDPEGGKGPGVVVIHEIPGLTPAVIGFGQELVDAGYTVVLPHLFAEPELAGSALNAGRTFVKLCVNREFTKLALGETTPMAGWLRSLARELHADVGGPGVGALGMCFTGGFALAMMVDDAVVAPVVAQPSTPLPIGKARRADLNLSPADLDRVRERAAAGCSVLGLQYAKDPATGNRFDTLDAELGEHFIRVDLEGKGHSTLTEQRSQQAVDAVLAFFADRLHPTA